MRRDLLISIGLAVVLLSLFMFAKRVPLQSYTGSGLCGELEKYTVLSGESGFYFEQVELYKKKENSVDPSYGTVDSARACPQDAEISLYLL